MAKDDTEKRRTSSANISRRRALELTAGGSVFALAGCLGGDGGSGNSGGNGGNSGGNGGGGGSSGNGSGGAGPSEGGSGMTDKTYVTSIPSVPTDIQYNPYSTAPGDFFTKSAVFAWTAQITTTSNPPTFIPMVAKDWTLDGSTFTVNLNESFTWHDGKSLTAEDVALHYNLDRHVGAGTYYAVWDFASSVEATGKYTLEMQLDGQVAEGLLLPAVFAEPLAYSPDPYKEYLGRFEQASSENEKSEILTELTELTIDEPVGAGPLKYVSSDAQKMVFEPYEKFPWKEVQQQFADATGTDITGWPDRLNFSTVHFKYAPSDRLPQEYRSGSLDGGQVPSSVFESLPSNYMAVDIPGLYGWSVIFNFWDSGLEDWLDSNVRKAFAHVLDREAMAVQFMNAEAPADKLMTGMTVSQEQEWLSQSFRQSLDPYERNTEKAAQYLEASGYTRRDGQWYKPNGERFVAKFKTASSVTNYVNGLQVAASNLNEFGIETQFLTEESTTYFSKEPNDQGYQLEATPGYGGSFPYPYHAFSMMYEDEQLAPTGTSDAVYYLANLETLSVPPVGRPNSNERITVDPYEKLSELAVTNDEQRQTALIEELAWATNQAVPNVSIVEAFLLGALNTDGWEYPPADSPPVNMKSAAFLSLMFQFGVIKAR